MRKKPSWQFWITLILLASSVTTYFLHYLIFRDAHHIFLYMVGDIGFLFIDVLLVILIIERLLSQREKRALMNKLNMVIGTFFSEVGLELLNRFSTFVPQASDLQKKLEINPTWSKRQFQEAVKESRGFPYSVSIDVGALGGLQQFLIIKRSFMLHLLDNPSLLEHERFTDMLWAVFHLAEELAFRGERLGHLPQADYNHLGNDLKRAYSRIVGEWIAYTQHLKESYPFLFSLAARVNPFSSKPSAIITS
jgi:hypothetical protein